MTLGQRLRAARVKKGLTQRALAQLLTIAQPRIAELENGTNPNPTLETLRNLADVLGVSVGYLLGEESDSELLTPHMLRAASG